MFGGGELADVGAAFAEEREDGLFLGVLSATPPPLALYRLMARL